MKAPVLPLLLAATTLSSSILLPDAEASPEQVREAMRRATAAFVELAAAGGGYVYYHTLDGRRLGEGEAAPGEIWVQPPGTPAVGEALLDAYEATAEPHYLKTAREAGRALVRGQLESGGWRNSIDPDPSGPRAGRYPNGSGRTRGSNFSTLDDDITQSALRFLSRLDLALASGDAEGRWVTVHPGGRAPLVGQPKFAEGEAYLSSEVFAHRLSALARYLQGR
jgi:hypothetical protein